MNNNLAGPAISIVIPVYNEEPNIIPLYESTQKVLKDLNKPWEIVFVDDGSSDGGPEILRSLAKKDPSVRLISFEKNSGQTSAFDAGFKGAKGEIIVTMDADMQNDPADIPKLLEILDKGDCELVCGWRFNRNDPLVKKISSKIANFVRNKLSNESIHDTGCSLKAFKREAILKVELFQGLHRFFPTLIKMHGFRVQEVKVNHLPRKFGESKYNISNRAFRAFLDLLAIRWMQKRFLRYKIKE